MELRHCGGIQSGRGPTVRRQPRPGRLDRDDAGRVDSLIVPPALTMSTKKEQAPILPEGPIFVGRGGERLLGPRHWFEDAVKKAGIANFTWHDLRHTFASRLVMMDVDIRTVAELMGHKKIQMTMRYAHLAPEHKLVAVERLKAYIR